MTEFNLSSNRHVGKALDDDLRQKSSRSMPCLPQIVAVPQENADLRARLDREIARRKQSEFDPFFTTRDASVGTGLGLSLIRRSVTEISGAIDVRSEPGLGATFGVYLPRAGDALARPDDHSLAAPVGRGQRVLVVDDQEPLLELTTDTLRELGYQPVGFASALDALRAFQAAPSAFDVLVTDHRMPVMSGDKLIAEIRRIRPLLPVILVSGYVGDLATSRSDDHQADEVLSKPLRASALATSLARLLEAG